MNSIATTADSRNVPEGWSRVRLMDLVSVRNGQVSPLEDPYRSMVLVAPDHIEGGTGRITAKETASSQGAISGKYIVEPGDVIYSKIRPYLQKAAISDFTGLCSADMYPLRPKVGVDSTFVLNLILSQPFTDFATSVSARSGIPKINRNELAEFTTLAPPAPEQKAIGDALNDVDSLVATLQEAIAKKQSIKQGMLQQLLTGKTRLAGFCDEWRKLQFSDLGRCIRGVAYNPELDLSRSATYETVELLRSNNIQDSQIVFSNVQHVHRRRVKDEQLLKSDDIMICMANGSKQLVGKAARFSGKSPSRYTFGAFMAAFRVNPTIADPSFVNYCFQTKAFRDWIGVILAGSSINNLRPRDVEGYALGLPELQEQKAIANSLADADAEVDALRRRLDQVRLIKRGMMQELLTGRTRLNTGIESKFGGNES